MATALSRVPLERVTHAALFAYLFALMGLTFVLEPINTLFTDGVTLPALGGLLFSCSIFGGAIMMLRNPDELRHGRHSAPVYLWILAGVSTLGAAFVLVARFG